MKTLYHALLGVAITATMLSASLPLVSAGDNLQAGCSHFQCPSCNHTCHVTIEPDVKDKYCWNVECKPVCIPSIRFPWQSCCEAPKCGKVIMVRKLKIHEYECPTCKCKWNVNEICPPCGCNSCGQQPCACGGELVIPHAEVAPAAPAAPAQPVARRISFLDSILGTR